MSKRLLALNGSDIERVTIAMRQLGVGTRLRVMEYWHAIPTSCQNQGRRDELFQKTRVAFGAESLTRSTAEALPSGMLEARSPLAC